MRGVTVNPLPQVRGDVRDRQVVVVDVGAETMWVTNATLMNSELISLVEENENV